MDMTADGAAPEGARGYEGFGGAIGRTFSASQPFWPAEPRAGDGAPNILIVLVDDMGYSDIGPFGSEIHTPTLDSLAARGVQLTSYHTAAVCSPARAALMTGLNPHRAGFAHVASTDVGFPGYSMEIAEDVLTLPEILREAGYATFAVGKWHLTRDGAMHDAAARRSWPTQRGFDRYFGCLEGLTNFFQPNRLTQDNSPVEIDQYPADYYLTDDLTDHAIGMLKSLRAHSARKPFLLYFAHNAVHGPLGARPADIARYRGRYDAGWDVLRAERYQRQMEIGLFPAGTRLAPRNFEPGMEVPAWGDVPAERRRLFARYQEVYAAMVDNIDQNLGRLLATVAAFGELDNTIVVFTSDNGGTAEGGPVGTRSYFSQFAQVVTQRGFPETWPRDVARNPDLIGGPRVAVHYPRGWGMASNTPFRLYKGNTFAGGVRVPFLISWPAGLTQRGIRTQYQYVTDLHATLIDLAGVARPAERHGRPAKAIDGVSFRSILSDATAPSTRFEQYSETRGNRGFYRDGWKLLTLHGPGTPYADQEWQLFDVRTDPTETTNVAAEFPHRVRELAAAWEAAAWANTVFPLPDAVGGPARRRPADDELAQPVRLLPGTPTLERYRSSRLIALRSFDVLIECEHAAGDEGVLVAHGDQGGGYNVYVEAGRLWLAYNEYGDLKEVDCGLLAAGTHAVRLAARAQPEFRWDLALTVDGVEVGRLDDAAMLLGLAPFEGIDVGIDRRSPVNWGVFERHGAFPYRGRLHAVTYTPGDRPDYDAAMLARATRDSTRVYE
ncbi:MAG TPA: arylsulfatase [Chloroflexota bacterium]|nr:arylsulfatase [Chloroflexota bacterium]